MTDELLEYLGAWFVKSNMHEQSGMTFETFVDLYQDGFIQEGKLSC